MRKQQKHNYVLPRRDFVLTNDKQIRASLLKSLNESCRDYASTRIIEELGIVHGSARIDIAVVNGHIHGYELKSDKDTLNRLPRQIQVYNTVLDRVTLVVGKSHLHEAIKIIPDWWGVSVAKIIDSKDGVAIYSVRESDQNPQQDNIAVAALLWRDEALNILEEINRAVGVRSKNKATIYRRLVEVLDEQTLKQKVRDYIMARVNWRPDLKYMPSDG